MTPPEEFDDACQYVSRRQRAEQARLRARSPKTSKEVVAQLLVSRGYGDIQASSELQTAWQQAAGERIAKETRIGKFQRGVLEIVVPRSIMRQELTFAKAALVAALQKLLPDRNLRDLRFSGK